MTAVLRYVKVNLDDADERFDFRENLDLARSTRRDPVLVRTLEKHLRRWQSRKALSTLIEETPFEAPLRRLVRFAKKRFGNRG